MSKRYTVACDFDGVIHSYTTPWINAETIPDPPVQGAIKWLNEIQEKFDVVIFSTRCKEESGKLAVLTYLYNHGANVDHLVCSYEKLPALVYIDDRAYRFEGPGTFPNPQQIHNLRPWYK